MRYLLIAWIVALLCGCSPNYVSTGNPDKQRPLPVSGVEAETQLSTIRANVLNTTSAIDLILTKLTQNMIQPSSSEVMTLHESINGAISVCEDNLEYLDSFFIGDYLKERKETLRKNIANYMEALKNVNDALETNDANKLDEAFIKYTGSVNQLMI